MSQMVTISLIEFATYAALGSLERDCNVKVKLSVQISLIILLFPAYYISRRCLFKFLLEKVVQSIASLKLSESIGFASAHFFIQILNYLFNI